MQTRRHGSRGIAAPVLLGLMVLLASGCRGQLSSKPPIHPNPNMDNVQRFDPQEPNNFFPDGRAMRPPVPGTVAVGDLREDPFYYEGRVGGELATELPPQVQLDMVLLQRGQQRFDIYCVPCHGGAGYGDGITTQRGMLSPPSFHQQRLREAPIGHFFDVMTNGIRNMPTYRYQIPVHDRWAIAAYIRALQLSQVARLDP